VPGVAGHDPACEAIKVELRNFELPRRRQDGVPADGGRACLLVGMSSHAQQRASEVWSYWVRR
jgi:hypothetical protein